MMIPTTGRIVHYTLTEDDVHQINRRRVLPAPNGVGRVVHIGNAAHVGDVFPLVITRVWGNSPESAVNGQVLLDGNDTLWVTSRYQVPDGNLAEASGRWYDPTRVDVEPGALESDGVMAAPAPADDTAVVEAALDCRIYELHRLFLDRHKKYGPRNIAAAPGGALNGLRVRLHDKLARINNYVDNGGQADFADDALRDAFLDIAGYALIGVLVLDGDWPT